MPHVWWRTLNSNMQGAIRHVYCWQLLHLIVIRLQKAVNRRDGHPLALLQNGQAQPLHECVFLLYCFMVLSRYLLHF